MLRSSLLPQPTFRISFKFLWASSPSEKSIFFSPFSEQPNTFAFQTHRSRKPRPQPSLNIRSNSWSEKSKPPSSTISTPFIVSDIEIMSVLNANTQILCREVYPRDQQQYPSSNYGRRLFPERTTGPPRRNSDFKRVSRRELRVEAFWPESRPAVVEMEAINDSDHLDQILLDAQNLSQPILIDWMAEWCRKCIYLKPKLEKLAAEYDAKVKFYFVDVNKVSQSLVKRGNISKMPTIQIWKDGEMKAEVIGGHKAWLVIEEVRAMIQNFL